MPWKATCHMDERLQFIARVLAGEDEMTVLCREYGVSRKTGYKWLGRYISEGGAGLAERSHAPVQHARRMMWPWCKRCWDCASAGRTGGQRSCG